MIRRGLVGFPLVLLALVLLAVFHESIGVAPFYITLLSTVFFWTAQATSWNILSGYSGYFSFGQGAFAGVGIYSTAVLTAKHGWNFYLTLPVAAVLSTVLALAIGGLAFRLGAFRGATFALLTLAVPFILAAVARLSGAIDGGQGLVVQIPELPGGLAFRQFLLLVTAAIAVMAVTLAYVIWHSRFGWALAAIRDNEDVAEQFGVATFRWKMLAIGVTGAIGGLAGSAWALQYGFVQVEVAFSLTIPLFVIVMAVLGGRTHWLGPVLGAVVITLMQDRLAGGFEGWRLIIFGGLLAAMVIFAPGGLWARLRARPLPVLVAGVAALATLAVVPGTGELLDWIAGAMIASAVVAFWPQRWLPEPVRRRAAGDGDASGSGADGGGAVQSDLDVESATSGLADGAAGSGPAGHESEAGVDTGATVAGADPAEGAADTAPRPGGSAQPAPAVVAQISGTAAGVADAAPVVQCHGLTRHYGGVRALDGLDLTIAQGELVALVGPNGSGKTTLVNLLSGAVRPSRGGFQIAGRSGGSAAAHTLTHLGVARTYQIPRPFESMTVRDNVALALMFGRAPRGLAEARAQALEHLEFVGLGASADAYPSDINLHQRQLLEMARALATSPRLLLLDEALAGLNPAEIDNAVQVVRRIHAAGVTIVIVEHLLRVVNQLATRIVVLDRGRLLADGEPQQVMSDPAVVAAYLGKGHRDA